MESDALIIHLEVVVLDDRLRLRSGWGVYIFYTQSQNSPNAGLVNLAGRTKSPICPPCNMRTCKFDKLHQQFATSSLTAKPKEPEQPKGWTG